MAKGQRIEYFDVAKGLLMISLLFAHFNSAFNTLGWDKTNFGWLISVTNFYTPFFMPAFFIISGYCSNFSKPWKEFILGNLKSIILPLIIFDTVGRLLESYILGHALSLSEILRAENFLVHSILWFLWALFIAKIINKCINGINGGGRYSILLILYFIGVLLNQFSLPYNFFCIKHALIASLFVAIGYDLKIYDKLYGILLKYGWLFYSLLYAFWIIVLGKGLPAFSGTIAMKITSAPIVVLTSVLGTGLIFQLSKLINKNCILQYIGKNTIIIYCTHFSSLLVSIKWANTIISVNTIFDSIFYVVLVYTIVAILMAASLYVFNIKPFKWCLGRF